MDTSTGVIILARALVGVRRRELYTQAGTYWNGNRSLFKALLLQRTDAAFGLPIIVIGFALQLVGATKTTMPPNLALGLLAAIFIVICIYFAVRHRKERNSNQLYDNLSNDAKED